MKQVHAIFMACCFFGCSNSSSIRSNSLPAVNSLDSKFLKGHSIVGGCAELNHDGSYTLCYDLLNREDGTVTQQSVRQTCNNYQQMSSATFKFVASCTTNSMATACSEEDANGVPSSIQITYADATPESVESTKQTCLRNGFKVLF